MKEDVAEQEEELDDFDPMAELMRLKDSDMDQNQRKSIWTMKYRMKNDLNQKAQKEEIINQKLLPGIREICLQNVAVIYKSELEETFKNIDKFEDQNDELDT